MNRFLDTYALVEILNGSEVYRGFLAEALTSIVHLYELHVQVARTAGDPPADVAFNALRGLAVPIEDPDILDASRFKRRHARKRLSYADALGYAMARRRGIPFVTGDRAFRDIEGVAFVPASPGTKG